MDSVSSVQRVFVLVITGKQLTKISKCLPRQILKNPTFIVFLSFAKIDNTVPHRLNNYEDTKP
jgi:hypothetical protein